MWERCSGRRRPQLGFDLVAAHAYRKESHPAQSFTTGRGLVSLPASETIFSEDQLFASLKATLRPQNVKKVRPFAIAGMGLIRSGNKFSTFETSFETSRTVSNASHDSHFSLRYGGGAEFVPRNRVSIRADVVNLSSPMKVSSCTITCGPTDTQWWNRLDVSLGVMLRIGAIH